MADKLSPEAAADESVAMLEDRELEVTILVVLVVDVMLEGGGLGFEATGGLLGIVRWVGITGNVVFRAGHPEGLASRRTGQ